MESTLTLVLAGGRGERLLPLTARRAKPVVPFAGRRLIDYTLENCRASGLHDVVVLTQHRAEDVHDHLDAAWSNLMPDLRTLSSDVSGASSAGPPMRCARRWRASPPAGACSSSRRTTSTGWTTAT